MWPMFEVDRIRKINGLIVGGGGGGDGLGPGWSVSLLISLAADSNLCPAQPRSHSSGAGNTLGVLQIIMGFHPSNM